MYESTFQIAIIFYSLVWTPKELVDCTENCASASWLKYSSLCSSFLNIGKGGAENLLTFGKENKMAGVSLLQKLKMVAKYSPVFALTTFFRVGCFTSTTFAAGLASDGYGVNAFVSGISFAAPLVFVVPLIVLLLCKYFLPMVTVGELIEGVIGEAFTITVWGKSGREGSRGLQLGMAVYHLVLHTVAAIAVFSTIPTHRENVFLTTFSLTSVGCGWIAFLLFIFQIFLSDEARQGGWTRD